MSKHEHEKTKITTPELCPSFLHAQEYYQDEPEIQKKIHIKLSRICQRQNQKYLWSDLRRTEMLSTKICRLAKAETI